MDAVKQFDIQLDLGEVYRIIDYGQSEEYQRGPKEPWDFTTICNQAKSTTPDKTDENRILQINMMDRAIRDRRLLEKKLAHTSKEQEAEIEHLEEMTYETDENISSLPSRFLPVYKPGQIVRGKLVLETSKPLEVEKIKINLLGRAFVSIRIYHGQGYYDHRKQEVYVDQTALVWRKTGSKEENYEFTSLMKSTCDHGTIISPGLHEFEFDFILPNADNCCSSVPSLVPSSHNCAHVSYRLKATLEKGNVLGRGNIAVNRGLWLQKDFDINQTSLGLPVSIEEKLDTGMAFWKGGTILCRISLPRSSFLCQQEIPLKIEIDNQTTTNISVVVASIVITGLANTGKTFLSPTKSINCKSVKQKGGEIVAGRQTNFEWLLKMDFGPSSLDNLLLPAGTLSDCGLIDIKYHVNVVLKRKGLHRNLELSVPIWVGTFDSANAT